MRQSISFASGLVACIAAVLLTACGGGGGGGGGGIALLPVAPSTTGNGDGGSSLPVFPAGTVVVLSGTASYESVPNPSGRLVYADTAVKPVRRAYVEVLNATSGTQLAITSTDDNGAYSASVPMNTNVIVRVRAQLLRTGALPNWDVTVRDNTQSSAIYSMQSSAFSTGAAALTRDLRAGSGWGGSSYTGQRVSGPFALMDTIYTAMQKVLSVAPASAFPSLKVFWSVNNTNSGGSIALGQIGTTFFIGRSSGAEIYVLGKEDVDTDEFDAPVIAHEWGHYYQASFSRDDSPGGAHSTTERIDRRLAFSEGWGNGWSGIALGRSNYVDSGGPGQADGGSIDLTQGPATNQGWFSETSIQSIFWNLNQQVGFKPIHDTMTGALFRSGAPVTSIHPFTAAFNATAPDSASALTTLLTGQGISAAANDAYGAQENNAGGSPALNYVLPMYSQAVVGTATSACVTNAADPLHAGNKLGSFAYLRFTAPASRGYQFTISPPGGANPNYAIYRGGVVSRNTSSVNLSAGDYVLVVNDLNNSAASTCFGVIIQ